VRSLAAVTLLATLAAVPRALAADKTEPADASQASPGDELSPGGLATGGPAFGKTPWESDDPFCTGIDDTISGIGNGLNDIARDLVVGAAAIVLPSIGARAGPSHGAQLQLSWPAGFAFGPTTGKSRRTKACGGLVYEHRPLRTLIEPGLALSAPLTVFVRPGLRYVWHRPYRLLGLGAGVGSTVELRGPDGARASVGAELLVHAGACCAPGYVLVSLRYDRFFAGAGRDVLSVAAGLAYY
jgi:hypothetical protein